MELDGQLRFDRVALPEFPCRLNHYQLAKEDPAVPVIWLKIEGSKLNPAIELRGFRTNSVCALQPKSGVYFEGIH
jgi:hypothetical protein